ncbi:hypothetical protein OPV22_005400 [Ensete ventricosum]|uniref:Epidermal patterning factor-like protein n=1 Tax=Ensete ventricosum TaxID=4639 RepID=A0AAV8RQY0_ENSVE|nr:hypothetical protein OPV22_005400 [Ensete ventricosum]
MSWMRYKTFLTASFLVTLLHLLLPLCCFNESSPLSRSEGMPVEDKARLGSAPPNCHNRCNECTPCTAVPDPTAPDRPHRVQPLLDDWFPEDKHSNYKPLGWKCRCGGNLYNP